MADRKITQLAPITGANLAAADVFVLVDVSDLSMGPTGTNKKIAKSEVDTLYDSAGTAAAAVSALSTVYQPLDADLTAIAALTTTAYGLGFLVLANQAGTMALLSASTITAQGIVELATSAETITGTDTGRAVTPAGAAAAYQPLDADLTAVAAGAILPGTLTTATAGVGYMGIPQNVTTTGPATIAAADAGKHIYSTATRTLTIDSDANLALPVGTTITFIAAAGATVTIAITADTLIYAGPGTTGSRTLAPHGMATAVKITSTSWIISGVGLS